MKLYVESTQAKLDELEKSYDPSKMDSLKKENEVNRFVGELRIKND